jgi:DNA repair exonuclease SbcCD ATPase subunit
MNIVKVEASNFRCFGPSFSTDMPTTRGLHLVTGRNLETPALGANGTGKSSTFAAICWALFKKTATGQDSGSLLRRGAKKGYSVTLHIVDDDGQARVLTRTWNPISLKLDNREIAEYELTDWLGLTYEQFLYSVYFPQSGVSFIDLTPMKKLAFLSQLFNLDKWVSYSELAKEKISGSKLELSKAQQSKTLFLAEIERVQQLIVSTSQACEQWKTDYEEKLAGIKISRDKVKDTLLQVPSKGDLQEQLKEIEETKAAFELDKKRIQGQLNELSANEGVVKHKLQSTTAKLESIAQKENTECPACLQVVGKAHVESISDGLFAEAEQLEEELVSVVKDKLAIKLSIEELEESINDALQLSRDVSKELSQIEALIRIEDGKINQIKFFDEQLAKTEKEINPHSSQLDDLLKRNASHASDTKTFDDEILRVETKISQYEFWQKHFPQVRLSILEEVTQELEIHFNQSFCTMGLLDWSVEISTEKELKSGATKNELTVKLYKDGVDIDIDSLSGGEKQRLRVCTNIGISDLIKARCGVTCDLLMIDEPCASLSQEGIDNLLGMLTALGETQTIMLAEHRVMDSAKFDSIFTLVKGVDATSVMERTA